MKRRVGLGVDGFGARWRRTGRLLACTLLLGLSPVAAQERHADPGLEALLPDSLRGLPLVRESQRGSELARRNAAFERFLKGLGRRPEDFVVASAYARAGLAGEVGAWRVEGADPAGLLAGFQVAVQESSGTPLAVAEEVVEGRTVTRIGDPGQMTRGPLYVVRHDDVLLFVQTPDPALAAEAIADFPE